MHGCCGIIVFYNDETVLVKSHKGYYSFPKGKKEDGESDMDTAFRELEEETCITRNDIELYEVNGSYNELFEEKNGTRTVKYYVAKMLRRVQVKVTDVLELSAVTYIKVDKVKDWKGSIFANKRKVILEQALNIHRQHNMTMTNVEERQLSTSLSWLLRHGIIKERMNMNSAGYVKVSDILRKHTFNKYSVEHIKFVVENSDKQRYKLIILNHELYIRANQGHCDEVGQLLDDEHMLTPISEPMSMCIHGTTKKAINMIKSTGLVPMSRKHIHLASGYVEDTISGLRHSSKVIIHINMELAMKDGKRFYLSDNGVILCKDTIEPKYFTKIEFV
jgi:2'-phosphotransferase